MRDAIAMFTAALGLAFAFGSLSASSSDEGADSPLGSAAISTGNTDILVSGTQTHPSPSDEPRNDAQRDDSPFTPAFPVQEFNFDSCLDDWNSARGCFRGTEEEEESPPLPDAESAAAPVITITDLAQFAPAPVSASGEPDNVGVAGMPTNFVAAASVQTRSGTLFGAPLTVRFTPVGYDFSYGDDTTDTTTSGGQTWAALGQAPFTPTITSHTYRDRGTYQAAVTVRYVAEVDLGGGWFPVAGQLTIDGTAQEIRIFEAHTALVAFTCEQRPTSPGC